MWEERSGAVGGHKQSRGVPSTAESSSCPSVVASCASEVGGGSALAGKEQSSLLIGLKGQFVTVRTGLTAPSDLQRCMVGCGAVSCLVLPFLTTQVKCTGISPLLRPEVLLSAGWKPILVWTSYKKQGSSPV